MEEDGDDFVVDQPPPPPPELDRQDVGKCDHYRRRCKLRAPCCSEIFTATTRPRLFVLYATLNNNRLLRSVQSVESNLGSTFVKFVVLIYAIGETGSVTAYWD
ncbi:hypothetical protein KY290_009894 [Solanum tuberosum]|uniref:Uncharacterized protein n=1 Tax=Solanum tuberosum TaxID=4113 RepID=A0ABQ7VYW5_SOLTU|nr:hypothetical protein KY289_010277 [Solanum tuberosum]KAH0772757.1 hypothetical protein KY290_009894 [Solanum tuberosum]